MEHMLSIEGAPFSFQTFDICIIIYLFFFSIIYILFILDLKYDFCSLSFLGVRWASTSGIILLICHEVSTGKCIFFRIKTLNYI